MDAVPVMHALLAATCKPRGGHQARGHRNDTVALAVALMAGRGPAPKAERYRRGTPTRGEWSPSPDGGWQQPIPEPPPGLTAHSVTVWEDWFRAWWAGNWTTDDLPMLRLTIRVYDRVMRGDIKRLPELRQWLDSAGITVKGRQDRRWQAPLPARPMTALERIRADRGQRVGPYDHLRQPEPRPRPTASERFAAMEAQTRPRPTAKERLAIILEAENDR